MMVRTGVGINGMKISKSGIVLPFVQKHSMVPMTPIVTNLNVSCLSNERIPFILPISVTTVPSHPDVEKDKFITFCRHFNEMNHSDIQNSIRDMIEGDIRIEASKMPVTSLLEDKDDLHKHIKDPIARSLGRIGLEVKAPNIKEVTDSLEDDTKYLFYLRQKAINTANFTAQKEVKASETDMRIQIAELDMDAVVSENTRDEAKVSLRAALAEAEALEKKRTEIKAVGVDVAVRQRKVDLE